MANSTAIACGSTGTLAQTATGFSGSFSNTTEVVRGLQLTILPVVATGSAATFIISGFKEPEMTRSAGQSVVTGQHATLLTALGSVQPGAKEVLDDLAVNATYLLDGTAGIHYVVALKRALY